MAMNEQRRPGRGGAADAFTSWNGGEDSIGGGPRQQPRLVKIAELWQRESAKGATYFSGFLGDAQLLLFDAGERDHPTRPGETVHVWKLMVQERDPSRQPGGGR